MTKQCRKCKETKVYADFDKKVGCIGGVVATCKVCRKKKQDSRKDQINARRRQLYALSPFKILARNSDYTSRNKETIAAYLKDYSSRNREILREYHREWSKEWRDNNRGLVNARANEYQAAKIQRSPPWLSDEHRQILEIIYDNCPKGYEVDHILPLRGKHVSGLHVPWNLQYLPMSVNRSKGNRIKSSHE